ncbi:MAG TPA: hypothetical protein PL108_07820 [Sediminibacterium sp.]|nr:hypothetical protein [Sediminibacterium sp.]
MNFKLKVLKKIGLIILIFLTSKDIFSQTVEEIYYQLPDKYLKTCPLAWLAEKKYEDYSDNKSDEKFDRIKLKRILHIPLEKLNDEKPGHFDPMSGSYIQTRLIDNKNGYIKFCDGGCTWEFVMKLFNSKNTKQKYIAIWSGDNDGATSGTNKELYVLEVVKNKSIISFKDVTTELKPSITVKEAVGTSMYNKYKKSMEKDFPGDPLFDRFELDRYKRIIIGYINNSGMLFYPLWDSNSKIKIKEMEIIDKVITNKKIAFKWNDNKFIRINKAD